MCWEERKEGAVAGLSLEEESATRHWTFGGKEARSEVAAPVAALLVYHRRYGCLGARSKKTNIIMKRLRLLMLLLHGGGGVRWT